MERAERQPVLRVEDGFEAFIVEEYFKCGTAPGVLRRHGFGIGMSDTGIQHVLNRFGVVKIAGRPGVSITESVLFFEAMLREGASVGGLHSELAEHIDGSESTYWRLFRHMKEGTTGRRGTALVITPYDNPELVLIGTDISPARPELGRPPNYTSYPMGFAGKVENAHTSVARILQHEVFTRKVIERGFPWEVIPPEPEPFMYVDIVDVQVATFHLRLPPGLCGTDNFESFKLVDYKFVPIQSIIKGVAGLKLRVGMTEIARGYVDYLDELENGGALELLSTACPLNIAVADRAFSRDWSYS